MRIRSESAQNAQSPALPFATALDGLIHPPARIFGVDFSGAQKAGDNTWIAELELIDQQTAGYRLLTLQSLTQLAGTAERETAYPALVEMIQTSEQSLWGLDFPFGLPVELFPNRTAWAKQLEFIRSFDGKAYDCGLECLRRAKELDGPAHIRRTTDTETRTPFDCYHYRIIYQTYFGMRDVLGPLSLEKSTAILPFQYTKLTKADRVLVETCPSSFLKRNSLPHQNYKQPAGGPLTSKRRKTRSELFEAVSERLTIPERFRRVIMRNPGGDALDAVLAAVGSWDAFRTTNLKAASRHPRYRWEGQIFA